MHEINIDDISLGSGFSHARYASVVSAIGVHNRNLFIGSSSISGDLWGGGLVVYNLKNLKNYFGRIAYEDESSVVDDISHQVVTEASFDSSVASIAPLNLSCSELTDAVVIGLDDGSIQLVTLREVSANSHQSQMQPLTINSATYHDWPLEKVIASQTSGSTNPHIITLDVAGCVKLWDCPSLMPIKSWSINSTTWPVNGSAFTPDISLLSTSNTNNMINHQNNCENFLLSTLNPLDVKRKICLWDIRVNDVSNPIVIQSSDCSNITHDLPTALSWFSTNHLLLGTYEGHLWVYDIRNPKMELTNVDVTNTNETFKSSSHRCKQAKQPYIEASELNANDVQVTLIMQGLQAPSRGFCGLIKPGCSGNFHKDSFNTTSASIRQQLGNGLLKVELGEYSLNVLCELTNPNYTYEYTVRQFPSKIIPTFCTFKIQNNKVKLRLRKACGSEQWAGALAVKGLDQS